MKIFKISALMLIGLALIISVAKWDNIERLYHVITLFDEDVIVENFSRIKTLVPTSEVKPSTEASSFDTGYQALPATFTYKEEKDVSEFLDRTSTTALLVLRGNTITYENYFQETKAEDHRISWSVAKSFISAMFGIAVDEGAIKSIEDTVTDYVPQLVGTGYEGVRIKDVLQMSSGVKFNEDYFDFYSDINRFGRTFALGGSFDEFAASLEREREPGTYLHYVSIDTHVLGMVLRAATGRTIVDYFNEKIWSKIEPESSVYFIVDGNNEPMVLGGMNLRTRDFARFGQLYANMGNWRGNQIVPKQWIHDSTTPDAPHLVPGKRDNSDRDLGYGFQWWLPEGADQEFMAMGIYGQFIYVNQKAGVVIVKNSAHLEFAENNYEVASESAAFFRAIVDSLVGAD
jgi:hypothetical protein